VPQTGGFRNAGRVLGGRVERKRKCKSQQVKSASAAAQAVDHRVRLEHGKSVCRGALQKIRDGMTVNPTNFVAGPAQAAGGTPQAHCQCQKFIHKRPICRGWLDFHHHGNSAMSPVWLPSRQFNKGRAPEENFYSGDYGAPTRRRSRHSVATPIEQQIRAWKT